MKVFLVIGYVDYEGSDVLKVLSTKEKAEAYKAAYLKDRNVPSYDEIKIYEWEVDVDGIELSQPKAEGGK